MQDWGKPRRPGRDRSRAPGRDPRADSDPPASTEETPLQPLSRPPSSRPRGSDAAARAIALEAELERLKLERAEDADQVAQMLVRVAAAERALTDAQRSVGDSQLRAAAAEEKAAVLAGEVARLKERCEKLETDAWDPVTRGARDRLAATRDAMGRIGALLEELERREEMAAGIRARTIEQLRQVLAEGEAPASPPVRPMPVLDLGGDPLGESERD